MIEEYSTLLHLKIPYLDKIFHKKLKKSRYCKSLAQIMGNNVKIVDQRTKKKGECDCIPWDFFRDYIS